MMGVTAEDRNIIGRSGAGNTTMPDRVPGDMVSIPICNECYIFSTQSYLNPCKCGLMICPLCWEKHQRKHGKPEA